MQSLKTLASLKLTSLAIKNELPGPPGNLVDYIGKVPNDVLEVWVVSMQTELQKCKGRYLKVTHFFEVPQQREHNWRMHLAEEAHKYGVCKDVFPVCHLCGDDYCANCWHDQKNGPITPCAQCYARQCSKDAKLYEVLLEEAHTDCVSTLFHPCQCVQCVTCKLDGLRKSAKSHAKGDCVCLFVGPHRDFLNES